MFEFMQVMGDVNVCLQGKGRGDEDEEDEVWLIAAILCVHMWVRLPFFCRTRAAVEGGGLRRRAVLKKVLQLLEALEEGVCHLDLLRVKARELKKRRCG